MKFRKQNLLTVSVLCGLAALLAVIFVIGSSNEARAQNGGPVVFVPTLDVRTVISGLTMPVSMAFLAPNDFLVLEKSTGQVKRIVNGNLQSVVLDLGVNFASERGLLGIALHPDFAADHGVYLYWTCRGEPNGDPFLPGADCPDPPTGGTDDTDDILAVPLRGNRVDRFVWNGESLQFDRNIIKLRSFQNDAAPEPPNQGDGEQRPAGNHDGGVIRFGPDGKLYIIFGDNGRRGHLQNLANGPTSNDAPDDQFGGPAPDDAHLTGVILRLNPDGSAPVDNPFFAVGASMDPPAGPNIQKIFAYGIRNSFGLAFDPVSGDLWDQENSDDAFDEINRVEPGFNSGWIRIMGPASRIDEFKSIELSITPPSLQQFRWPPANIDDSPGQARSNLVHLQGSQYKDPEFSWKFAVAPAAIGFVKGNGLGSLLEGNLIVGASRLTLLGGYLFRFDLAGNRRSLSSIDPRLRDNVADNTAKFDIAESETLLFGRDFGVGTDIQTGPNGNLYVVSLSNGAVYEIHRR